MNKKKDELNLKGPDAFQVRAAESVEFARKNSGPIYAAVGVAAVLALLAFGYQQFQESSSLDRQAGLSEVDIAREKVNAAHQEKLAEVEKQIDDLKLLQKENKEGFDAAKLASLEAELKSLGETPDLSAVIAKYKSYYDANPDTPEGWVAGMRYAASLAEDNKLDEASKIVKGVYEKSVAYGIVHHQSGMVLISLLEDQKKFEESVAVADKLLSTAGEGLKPQYLLAKARGLYLQNKKEDAAKVADEIIEKHENTQESEKARGLKALIN